MNKTGLEKFESELSDFGVMVIGGVSYYKTSSVHDKISKLLAEEKANKPKAEHPDLVTGTMPYEPGKPTACKFWDDGDGQCHRPVVKEQGEAGSSKWDFEAFLSKWGDNEDIKAWLVRSQYYASRQPTPAPVASHGLVEEIQGIADKIVSTKDRGDLSIGMALQNALSRYKPSSDEGLREELLNAVNANQGLSYDDIVAILFRHRHAAKPTNQDEKGGE